MVSVYHKKTSSTVGLCFEKRTRNCKCSVLFVSARSVVFSAMFEHEMEERRQVCICFFFHMQQFLLRNATHGTYYAVARYPSSVCLSPPANFSQHRIATPFWFFHTKHYGNTSMATPLTGAPNAGGVQNHDFRPVSRFFSETIQDRAIVTIECEQETVPKLSSGIIFDHPE